MGIIIIIIGIIDSFQVAVGLRNSSSGMRDRVESRALSTIEMFVTMYEVGGAVWTGGKLVVLKEEHQVGSPMTLAGIPHSYGTVRYIHLYMHASVPRGQLCSGAVVQQRVQ